MRKNIKCWHKTKKNKFWCLTRKQTLLFSVFHRICIFCRKWSFHSSRSFYPSITFCIKWWKGHFLFITCDKLVSIVWYLILEVSRNKLLTSERQLLLSVFAKWIYETCSSSQEYSFTTVDLKLNFPNVNLKT